MRSVIYIFGIILYEMESVVLPTPIEAPMFLFPELPRFLVLAACGIGKGTGSYLLFKLGPHIQRMRIFQMIVTARYVNRVWGRLIAWSDRIGTTYGFAGFLICQATPGLPMRSPIYSATVLALNPIQFAIGSGIGAIIRCAIVFGTYAGIRKLVS